MPKYMACHQEIPSWISSPDSLDPADPSDRAPQPPIRTSLPHTRWGQDDVSSKEIPSNY
jgi:hypothetical protein